MYLAIVATALSFFCLTTPAQETFKEHHIVLPLPSRTVYQFPNPTWIENLAVRSNGQLLLNVLSTPDLYLLDPLVEDSDPYLLYTFPDTLGLLGITEMQDDVFYILSGNFSLATGNTGPGTYAVWKVDLTSYSLGKPWDPKSAISKVVDMPEAKLLNSLIPLKKSATGGIVLISDSYLGAVWQLDVSTGEYSILLAFPEMTFPADAKLPIGINGLRLRGDWLYWANSEQNTFCRVKIDSEGQAISAVETLVSNVTFIDDFAFDRQGNAWVALDPSSELGVIRPGQDDVIIVLGSSSPFTVAGPTSVQFGRACGDTETLYVVTNGGLANPVNGTITVGAQVLAVGTGGFYG
ncbi:hypothetical protein BP6252_01804 [Coleophoma cylindrospora]|uniref:SMP-30/Gluconolactonase/LRE-like region domain-containing protein n=1 Tax=Coleophoma cylindrospora TaxID=1849047 RepID=A0A3D8STY4_9HELO|nr:hypothetical protein BP6252_01804 [Coleophoma cylindrospora]